MFDHSMRPSRTAFILGLVAAAGLGGCDISARAFSGAILQLTISGATTNASTDHIELWARDQYDDIIRINQTYNAPDPANANNTIPLRPFGFVIRNAISMADPCMIDAAGNLVTTAAAYPKTTKIDGVTQSPEEQAAGVRARIAQLTTTSTCDEANHCGVQPANLLATIPFDPAVGTPPLQLTLATSAADRLAACQAYWATSLLAYTPNPSQLVLPTHGTVTGFLEYTTQVPVQGFNSVHIESPTNLKGIRELFMTVETIDADDLAATPPRPDGVDPLHRGPLFLQGYPTDGGLGVVFFNLRGPNASGTAGVEVDLDQSTTGF